MDIPISDDFKLGFSCGAIVGCFFWIIDICVSIRRRDQKNR